MHRVILAFCFLSIAAAANCQDFEVSPVLMSFNANPGEIQKKEISLINHSSKPQQYTFKLSDYELDSEGNKKAVPPGSSKRSFADWITINPSTVELNPNQTVSVEVLMAVPKDGFKTRWGMIYVEVAKEQTAFEADKNLATGVVIIPRIVILIKQTPKSNNNYNASIYDLKEITKPEDNQRSFEVQVSNTGDNVIEANISLVLANMQTAKEEKFNPVTVTIYPDAVRRVKLQLPNELSKGNYALAAILDYGHRQPLEGTQLLMEVK
jgi:hypothetical protein